jgi:hypothetical protein
MSAHRIFSHPAPGDARLPAFFCVNVRTAKNIESTPGIRKEVTSCFRCVFNRSLLIHCGECTAEPAGNTDDDFLTNFAAIIEKHPTALHPDMP